MQEVETKRASIGEDHLAGKYLTFTLGQQHYGIPVLQVREIIRYTTVTPVPRTREDIKGVLNLRGKVIPILDLRVKFRLERAEIADRTCVIVAQITLPGGANPLMGFVVDGVEAVTQINANEIEPTPDFGSRVRVEGILGMAKQDERVIVLLDLPQVTCGDPVEPTVEFSPACAARQAG